MLETARDQAYPKITQIAFFLPNRVGSLQRVAHVLDESAVRICGMSILDSHDHAVVRIVVDNPDKAIDTLGAGGRATCTTQLLAVAVPDEPDAVSRLLGRLLRAELNVYYAYALLVRHGSDTLLMDLNSANGTYVNSRRVSNQVLANDDVVTAACEGTQRNLIRHRAAREPQRRFLPQHLRDAVLKRVD